MTLKIKQYLSFYHMIDERNNVVCKIKRRGFWNAERLIYNSNNKLMYTSDIIDSNQESKPWSYLETRKYIVKYADEKQTNAATASVVYDKSDMIKKTNRLILKLPRADEINIDSVFGELHVKRLKDESFTICKDEKIIGSISRYRTFRVTAISCESIRNSGFLAVLFVLVQYMLHEDDLIIV